MGPLAVSNATAIKGLEFSDFGLAEENYHPITGEPVAPMAVTNISVVEDLELSGFGPAEENFHPVTGE